MAYKSSLLHLVFLIAVLSQHRMIASSLSEPFDANDDAIMLRRGIENPSELKQIIFDVLTKRVQRQRLDVVEAYERKYKKNLVVQIKRNTHGYHEKIVEALLTPLPYYYAFALSSTGGNVDTVEFEDIIEILCTQSDSGLQATYAAYEHLFNKPFKVKGSSGHINVIERLCVENRDENQNVDEEEALNEVQTLFETGERIKLHEYMDLVQFNNHQQLRQIISTYENRTGLDFDVTMMKDLPHHSFQEYLFIAIVRAINSKFDFLAKRLHATWEQNMDAFIRIVVSRSEIDLGDIKKAFQKRYNETLEDYINDINPSDDFVILLHSLISSPERDISEIQE